MAHDIKTPLSTVALNLKVLENRLKELTIGNNERIELSDELFKWLEDNGITDTSVIILWNPSDDPAVKTTLENALTVIDDVTAVGSDTFMYSELGYVIEFYHDGEVTVGMAN